MINLQELKSRPKNSQEAVPEMALMDFNNKFHDRWSQSGNKGKKQKKEKKIRRRTRRRGH